MLYIILDEQAIWPYYYENIQILTNNSFKKLRYLEYFLDPIKYTNHIYYDLQIFFIYKAITLFLTSQYIIIIIKYKTSSTIYYI